MFQSFLLTVRPFYPQSTSGTGSLALHLSLPPLAHLSCSSTSLLFRGRVLSTVTCCTSQHKLTSAHFHSPSPLAERTPAGPKATSRRDRRHAVFPRTRSHAARGHRDHFSGGSVWRDDRRFVPFGRRSLFVLYLIRKHFIILIALNNPPPGRARRQTERFGSSDPMVRLHPLTDLLVQTAPLLFVQV